MYTEKLLLVKRKLEAEMLLKIPFSGWTWLGNPSIQGMDTANPGYITSMRQTRLQNMLPQTKQKFYFKLVFQTSHLIIL